MSEKKLRFKLSPELADGDHWTIADDKAGVLAAVEAWCDHLPYHGPGEAFTVETVEMTDEEVNALPDI